MTDKQFKAYSKWLKVHPRYYDRYGYDAWKRFNTFFYDLYDIPYDIHDSWRKRINNQKAKRVRINKYVSALVDSSPTYDTSYLCTLTFTDDVLNSTNEETRLRYVKLYMKSTFLDYIGCIDYGKVNGREHYHFIVNIYPLDKWDIVKVSRKGVLYIQIRDKPLWPYGFMSICPLDSNVKRASNYAFKASNYAFKSSDSEHSVFHARGVSHWQPLIDYFDIFDEG